MPRVGVLLAVVGPLASLWPPSAQAREEMPTSCLSLPDMPAGACEEALPSRIDEWFPPRDPKSYLRPALEVSALNLGIWGFDALVLEEGFAQVGLDSLRRNLREGWAFDDDDFDTNFALHPYHGSLHMMIGRSSGLSFWESALFAAFGSLVWEIGLETQAPSLNDQVMTTVGGTFLGETLYRVSDLLLRGVPAPFNQVAAFIVAPTAAVNRLAFGAPAEDLRLEPPPATWRLWVGGSSGVVAESGGSRRLGLLPYIGFSLSYGRGPAGAGRFRRPFDHFDLSVCLAASEAPWRGLNGRPGPYWALFLRGLLAGKPLETGGRLHGIWGIFGTYDYAGPTVFRVGTAGVGPGLTAVLETIGGLHLEASSLAAIDFGSVGGVTPTTDIRNYQMGVVGHLLLEAKARWHDRVSLIGGVRRYVLGAAVDGTGAEGFSHATAALVVRIAGRHGLGAEAVWGARRNAGTALGDDGQQAAYFSLYYTLLSGAQPINPDMER